MRITPRNTVMLKRQRVTSRQVAQHAGVSQTTVSFVLNDVESANISEETRQRVLSSARELGYVPDAAARSLARGSSSNIALILGQPHEQVFIDEFLPTVVTGLNKILRANKLRLLVEIIDNEQTHSLDALIRGKEIAGMILLFNNPSPAQIEAICTYAIDGFPVVSLQHIHVDIPSVVVMKIAGVRRAVEHLARLGHKRIACISYAPLHENHHAMQRLVEFKRALAEHNIPYDDTLVRDGGFNPDSGYDAMQSILTEAKARPTALFAMNDVMAFGAMAAIHDFGLCVPDDIAVVGFDDIRLAAYARPPLTTVREPDVQHGRRAGELLIQLIHGQPTEPIHIQLETELVIRDSCGYRAQVEKIG